MCKFRIILAICSFLMCGLAVAETTESERMETDSVVASYFTSSQAKAELDNGKLARIRSFFSSNPSFFACVYRQDDFRSSFINGEQYNVVKNEKEESTTNIQISGIFAVADIGTIGRGRAFIDKNPVNIRLVDSVYLKRGYETRDGGFFHLGSRHTNPELIFEIGDKKVDVIAVSNQGLIGAVDGLIFELVSDSSRCKSGI